MTWKSKKYTLPPDLVKKPSVLVIILSACFAYWFVDLWRPNNIHDNSHNFHWDVFGYYSYLPATFFNNGSMDWPMELANHNPYGPLGTHVPKYTYGMSVMYAPFFALACKIAVNQGSALNGFSEPFATCIRWGSIFYVILGLFFLRKFLLVYFNEIITGLVLLACLFGSMLFFYAYVQSELTHGHLFFLFCVFLYLTQKWHEQPTYSRTFFIGFVIGLISLVRPTDVYVFVFFLFWKVRDWHELKAKFFFFFKRYPHFILIALTAGALWIPQLIFYKHHAGAYFYFSYMREEFFWSDPQIINILFSYRKGWVTYTPLVALAFIGFFFIKKEFPISKWVFLMVTAIIVYIFSCWWDWGYGGCFGARSFCQAIAWLSVPLAYILNALIYPAKRTALKAIGGFLAVIFIFSCICLNIGQSYQYQNSKIHPWSMTNKAYWTVFRKYKYRDNFMDQFWSEIKEPDFVKLSDGSDRDQ